MMRTAQISSHDRRAEVRRERAHSWLDGVRNLELQLTMSKYVGIRPCYRTNAVES